MSEINQSNIEEINADVISLDTKKGIQSLNQLKKKNQQQNIKCQYKDFTFDIELKNVTFYKGQNTGDIKTIISKPKNLAFNGQLCNASEEDDKNTITIVNDGEELQFEKFTFNKQPYENNKITDKTIFDNIVETGITQAFGYNEFKIGKKDDIKDNINDETEYNFPLHYNAHGIFKIPNSQNNNIKQISIQGQKYDLTDKSAILFTPNTIEEINIIDDPSNKFKFIVIDVNGENLFNVNKNNIVGDVKGGKFNCATEVKLQYDEMYDRTNKETETQNNNNIFAKIFCCCYNKTSVNEKAEINIPIVHQFRNIKGIDTYMY